MGLFAPRYTFPLGQEGWTKERKKALAFLPGEMQIFEMGLLPLPRAVPYLYFRAPRLKFRPILFP